MDEFCPPSLKTTESASFPAPYQAAVVSFVSWKTRKCGSK
jgi:hypothetical protein